MITPYGCTREYFGDRAAYARPGTAGEIAAALAKAWDARAPDAGLARYVLERFSWSIVARETREAYDRVAA